ncbi:MAG: hypothetical protein QME55_08890 [Brevundimonas sp.]|uniref:hypothetical protein n=1 Tax=Brevundimonas sp. TaxID=1871086 RepID=UPI0026385B75|nr:hypothetical protein [Brevundimonas sp.]MDI6624832.1 hypothetical protein [Brevundimonas sp.]MDQ7813858.1 hypothetical protein [Brevundimonas sp.]
MVPTFLIAVALSSQVMTGRSDWVVTHADRDEATAVNIGDAFVPDGRDFKLALAYTVYRHGTAETRWTTPAYRLEFMAFRCADRTYRIRRSILFSGVADPAGPPNSDDGPYIDANADPRRSRQLDVVCDPATGSELHRFRDYFRFMDAYGLNTRGP